MGAMIEREITADRGDAGQRIDLVLRRHLCGDVTRTGVQRSIAAGRVTVNGATVDRVARRVATGDRILIALAPPPPRKRMAAENGALDVIFEDQSLLIVNKPPGVVVHPTYRHDAGTLMNALLWRARMWPDGERPSIVGRLDKQTSGLVVVARSRSVHAALQRELLSPRSEKDYLAIVDARVTRARGVLDAKLARDPEDRRRVVVSASGVASETRFVRFGTATYAERTLTLLRCRLMTGRMHQIRVHLAESGWPIVGDRVYGRPESHGLMPRQALHAWRLAMTHPVTRRPLEVTASIPDDLSALLALSGLDRALGDR